MLIALLAAGLLVTNSSGAAAPTAEEGLPTIAPPAAAHVPKQETPWFVGPPRSVKTEAQRCGISLVVATVAVGAMAALASGGSLSRRKSDLFGVSF